MPLAYLPECRLARHDRAVVAGFAAYPAFPRNHHEELRRRRLVIAHEPIGAEVHDADLCRVCRAQATCNHDIAALEAGDGHADSAVEAIEFHVRLHLYVGPGLALPLDHSAFLLRFQPLFF